MSRFPRYDYMLSSNRNHRRLIERGQITLCLLGIEGKLPKSESKSYKHEEELEHYKTMPWFDSVRQAWDESIKHVREVKS